jgi:hypothetical protein
MNLRNLTWSDFDQFKPCYDPTEAYGDFNGTIIDVLKDKRIPTVDRIWAFTCKDMVTDKVHRLFAVACARSVQHLLTDEQSIKAIDLAERYANGEATDDELEAAWAAAWAAAEAAEAAWAAVWAAEAAEAAWAAVWAAAAEAAEAAWAAVWAAAAEAAEAAGQTREHQVQIAIELIEKHYNL